MRKLTLEKAIRGGLTFRAAENQCFILPDGMILDPGKGFAFHSEVAFFWMKSKRKRIPEELVDLAYDLKIHWRHSPEDEDFDQEVLELAAELYVERSGWIRIIFGGEFEVFNWGVVSAAAKKTMFDLAAFLQQPTIDVHLIGPAGVKETFDVETRRRLPRQNPSTEEFCREVNWSLCNNCLVVQKGWTGGSVRTLRSDCKKVLGSTKAADPCPGCGRVRYRKSYTKTAEPGPYQIFAVDALAELIDWRMCDGCISYQYDITKKQVSNARAYRKTKGLDAYRQGHGPCSPHCVQLLTSERFAGPTSTDRSFVFDFHSAENWAKTVDWTRCSHCLSERYGLTVTQVSGIKSELRHRKGWQFPKIPTRGPCAEDCVKQPEWRHKRS